MISHQVQSGGASWTKFEHSLMKIRSDLGIPTPFPTVGRGVDPKRVNVYNGSVVVHPSLETPYFHSFSAHADTGSRGLMAVLARKGQTGSPTDGVTG